MIDLQKYKERALKILSPIRESEKDFLSESKRSNSRKYPPKYYLIFFLFSNLLGFKNLGRFDKIAWSFPVYYKGKAFLIEHRKSGVGIFIQDKKMTRKMLRYSVNYATDYQSLYISTCYNVLTQKARKSGVHSTQYVKPVIFGDN